MLDGVVTAIYATLPGGSKAECKVIVTKPIHVKSISIPETFEMKNKSSETLELTINPENTTDEITPEWSSSNDKVDYENRTIHEANQVK